MFHSTQPITPQPPTSPNENTTIAATKDITSQTPRSISRTDSFKKRLSDKLKAAILSVLSLQYFKKSSKGASGNTNTGSTSNHTSSNTPPAAHVDRRSGLSPPSTVNDSQLHIPQRNCGIQRPTSPSRIIPPYKGAQNDNVTIDGIKAYEDASEKSKYYRTTDAFRRQMILAARKLRISLTIDLYKVSEDGQERPVVVISGEGSYGLKSDVKKALDSELLAYDVYLYESETKYKQVSA
ncbi:hypothetical protein BZA77DRAFT_315587 [Pyronema omphalodes]|nr:hypothetical protein BZA77DRAFT_315587 [Pyronema omphalodes]